MGRLTGDLKERVLRFGEMLLRAAAGLPNESRGWVVGKQLIRSGTSIGANVWEADGAISDADFAYKISVARKEASETEYWLELIRRAEMLEPQCSAELLAETKELSAILATMVRKTQEHIRAQREH